ncbi:MAG: ArsC family reductase [Rhodocyclaceae bacterium]|nr:ArsC family reductase [Rhodocyclaceae bacterium]MDZ4213722.1 ArsC family reductase [Rhodocyclaceae bacterium]
MTDPTPTNTTRLYGIKNCDSMKKAFTWLDERDIPYEFHDYKKAGVPRERLVAWCKTLGWKTLLNTKGTTWRKLTPEQQDITTQSKAVALMIDQPSVIRRPLVETANGHLLVGFDQTMFESFVQ